MKSTTQRQNIKYLLPGWDTLAINDQKSLGVLCNYVFTRRTSTNRYDNSAVRFIGRQVAINCV